MEKLCPLHPAQVDVFIAQVIDPTSPRFNTGGILKLVGRVDPKKFIEIANKVLVSFDVFKIRFDYEKWGLNHGTVEESFRSYETKLIDFSTTPNPSKSATSWAQDRFNLSFTIKSESLLFEQFLLKIAKNEYWLFARFHHLLSDGYGFSIYSQVLAHQYSSTLDNDEEIYSPSYLAEAIKASNYYNSSGYLREENYWRERLAGDFEKKLLKKNVDKAFGKNKSLLYLYELDETQRQNLLGICSETNSSIAQLTIAALLIYFGNLNSNSEFVFGTAVHRRTSRGLRKTVGMFTGVLPFKGEFKKDDLLIDLLKNIRQSQRQDYRNQNYLLSDLNRLFKDKLDNDNIWQIIINYELFDFNLNFGRDIKASATDLSSEYEMNPLLFGWRDYGEQQALWLRISFLEEYFSLEEIEYLVQRIIFILEQFPRCLYDSLDKIEIVPITEQEQLLEGFNDTNAEYPRDKTVMDLFEAQVLRTPEAVAVVYEGQELSYRELNERSNQLGHYLRGKGVKAETLVPICIERSLEMLIGILGIMKAGGGYVPIDPEYPADRINYMLEDTGGKVIVSSGSQVSVLPQEEGLTVIELDTDWHAISREPVSNISSGLRPSNLAYVIYTSGSTGRPKGVMIEHGNVVNYLLNNKTHYLSSEKNTGGSVLNLSYTFDASITAMFMPLLWGKMLVLSGKSLTDIFEDTSLLKNSPYDFIKVTPAQLGLLESKLKDQAYDGLTKKLVIGGEELKAGHIENLYGIDLEIVNEYGPTEATVGCSTYTFNVKDGAESIKDGIPIGRPISNTQIYILNKEGKLSPIGVGGEICIGGAGLARGYLNRSDLTSEKFINNPFSSEADARIYRTGDLGRWLPDGNIEFLGRIDDQVKIRGYRIELGEIEACLSSIEGVHNTKVIVSENESVNNKILNAYLQVDIKRLSLLSNYLKLLNEKQIQSSDLHVLPNGLPVLNSNLNEVKFLYQEIFEDHCYLKHGITLNEDSVVVDIGANVGFFSIFLNILSEDIIVYSIEPIPEVYNYLSANRQLYNIKGKAFQLAILDIEKEVDFTYYPGVSIVSGISKDGSEVKDAVTSYIKNSEGKDLLQEEIDALLEVKLESKKIQVQAKTLSQIIEEEGIEKIDLLKIDVENSEHLVIDGISSKDWNKIGSIIIEVHDTAGRLQQIKSILEQKGFTTYVEKEQMLSKDDILYNLFALRSDSPNVLSGLGQTEQLRAKKWSHPQDLIKTLRSDIAEKLPAYMIPSNIILLDKFPMTRNGKIDKNALPKPDGREEANDEDPNAIAETEAEKALSEIWQELLGLDRVGIHDNFFELGGHSLLAIRVISTVRKRLGIEVPIDNIFDYPTIYQLSSHLSGGILGDVVASIEVYEPRPERIPLSFGQERLWFIDQLEGSVQYHIPAVLRLKGFVDKDGLAYAFQSIINRHEVLRTVIEQEEGAVYQRIMKPDSWSLGIIEEALYSEDPELLRDKVAVITGAAFDLSSGHNLRAELIRVNEQEHLLVLTLHHIASDGWSLPILVKELVTLYNAGVSGQVASLPALPIQYADYSIWQREYLQGEVLSKKLGYWQERLQGVLPLNLPTDYSRPAVQSHHGSLYGFVLDVELSAGLQDLSQAQGVTLFMTLLSAFKVMLYRYSGQEDISVGSPVANRGQHEVEGLIGFFVNMLVLRSDLSGDPRFTELLHQVREMAMEAYEHQDVPFEKVVDAVVTERDMSRSPLFQVLFSLQNNTSVEVSSGSLSGLEFTVEDREDKISKFDMSFSLTEGDEGLYCGIEYCTDLYKEETIARMAVHYRELLSSIVKNPASRLSQLEMLTPDERKQLLEGFNDTNAEYPRDKTVMDLFEAQVLRTPEAVAVVYEGQELSYRELNERSNQLGHYLRGKGVKAETLVPICIERSLEMLIGILGIMKAGGGYVPIDPEYPADRINYMLEDTGGKVIVSSGSQVSVLPQEEGLTVIELDTDWHAISREPVSNISSGLRPSNLAYVIYTSGSTGRPKGVMIEHGNVVNFILGMTENISIKKNDNLLAITSLAFDISVLELFWTLCNGIMVTLKGNDSQLNHYDKYVEGKNRQVNFSLFYFASQANGVENKYQFLLDSVTYADKNNFSSVWLPERHFHEFGGLFPNPAVLGAGLATITQKIQIRSGSVVLPLNDVIRVAEEWSVVDNLSNGRVSLSIASGWHADDFALMPSNYEKKQEIMYNQIEELKALWSGSSIKRINGHNKEIEVKIFPRPVQPELSIWITSAGNAETFKSAGKIGAKVLTHLLGQTIKELEQNISIYKQSLHENGHDPENAEVALMLHTYLGIDHDRVKSEVKEPFKSYLRSNISLLKNLASTLDIQIENINEDDISDILEIAFERYWQTAALLGTVESSELLVNKLSLIGVTEIACLIDFGIDDKLVLNSLEHLNTLRLKFEKSASSVAVPEHERIVTGLQTTPSYLGALIEDGTSQRFLESLDLIMVGGERLPETLLERLFSRTRASIYNMYGPTETTIWSTMKLISKDGGVTIGKPIKNTSIYILNSAQGLCPIGVAGELYIGGAGVSRGYYKKEELTQERFISNPYSDADKSRLYRTGDIAKWLPDGEIEFLGRLDDQVKIRGYRIELGEIESVLGQCEQVSSCVILAREDKQGNKHLVGYIVPNGDFDKEGILLYLSDKLPEYMIPWVLLEIGAIPLTSNGKIDRRSLPLVEAAEHFRNHYVGPRNDTEAHISEIWQELLGLDRVGVHDNFFEIGGHSLGAIRLVSKIRSELKKEISIRDIFDYPTIYQLSSHLSGGILGDVVASIEVYEPRPERIPLSFGQERLWFIDQLEGSVQYHIPAVLRLKGFVDKDGLAYAFQSIINRHEVLRTVIEQEEGAVYQRIMKPDSWSLGIIEEALYSEDPELLRDKVAVITGAAFDLSSGHNLRAELIRVNEQEHLLVLTLHHIASDGWSLPILVKELVTLYNAGVSGQVASLPALPIQYADYSIWQREYLQGEVLSKKLGYWQERLQGVLPLNLPTDYSRPAVQSHHGSLYGFVLDVELSAGLQDLSQAQGVTLFMTLLSAFKVMLYRYSGQEDISVGSPVANRGQHEVEGLIGFFVNMLVLRSDLSGDPRFTELLHQVREMAMEAYEHQDVPFEKVVDAVVTERDMSRSPLFQVLFSLQNNTSVEVSSGSLSGLEFTVEDREDKISKFDMSFSLTEGDEGLYCGIEYCTDLYKEETIARMAVHYRELLSSIVKNPASRLSQLEMLTPDERKQLLEGFNDTNAEYPRDKTVMDLFEAQVLRTPEAVAVVYEGQELSYRELNERSNQLGHYLRGKGVKAETLVPICIERSLEMLIGILGIMKAGGGYVPIDPEYPADRINYMLEDTGGKVIVSSGSQVSVLPQEEGLTVIELDTDWHAISREPVSNISSGLRPSNLAYVIYTSGSTGRPKGVMIEHGNVVNYLLNNKTHYLSSEKNTGGSVLNLSYTFDASITAMFMPLLWGKMLVLSGKSLTDIFEDTSLLKNSPYDFIKVTPAQLGLLESKLKDQAYDGLTKKLVIGGEELKAGHIENLYGIDLEIVNEYGPTEATVGCSTYTFNVKDGAESIKDGIPIGRPISNTQIYILNKEGKLSPIGVGGEICIGGAGLARGYLNRSDLTSEKFINNPFSSEADARIYRTGDLGRWLPDGNIEFLGRIDDQVKIRGYRIELGEIEACLSSIEGVHNTKVIVSENESVNNKILNAYLQVDIKRLSLLSNYLKLLNEKQIQSSDLHVLPNGLPVLNSNLNEVKFLYQEIFEDHCYLKHGITLNEDSVVVDIGANVGFFSIFLNILSEDIIVYSIEPIPEVYNYLSANRQLYNIKGKAFQLAILDIEKEVDFTYYPGVSIVSGISKDGSEVKDAVTSYIKNSEGKDLLQEEIDALLEVKLESKKIQVQAKTLSQIIEEEGIEKIDLLKIDVENSEHLVIDGISSKDWNKIGSIIIEVHDTAGRLQQIKSILEQKGFTTYVEKEQMLSKDDILYNLFALRSDSPNVLSGLGQTEQLRAKKWSHPQDLIKTLRSDIAEKLPAYMIPSNIILLDKFPMTRNGKIDKNALPKPDGREEANDEDPNAIAETEAEKALSEIWQELLGLDRVGIHDNFFELGGHSLLAIRVISTVRKRLGIEVPIDNIFDYPTIYQLSSHLSGGILGDVVASIEVYEPRPERIPLSFGQERLWFIDQLEGSVQYHIPAVLRLKGFVDKDGLAYAFQSIINRHEVLRTVIEQEEGAVYQRIMKPDSWSLGIIEEALYSEDPELLRDKVAVITGAAFDLSSGHNLRAELIRVNEQEHLLVLTLHHIASDGWSLPILVKELVTLYNAGVSGQVASLPALPIQYADYSIWQREYLQGEVLSKKLGYWQERLQGVLPLNLPTDYSRPAVQSHHGSLYGFVLDVELSAGLQDLSQAQGVTLFMTLLSAFKVMLYRYSGQEDISVGSPVANRGQHEVEGLIGFFVNMLVLRSDLSGDPRFTELLHQVREMAMEAYEHQDVPFEKVVDAVVTERDMSRSPLFQVLFSLQNNTSVEVSSGSLSGLEFTVEDREDKISKFDMSFSLTEGDEGLYCGIEYCTDLYKEETIARMAVHYRELLSSIVKNPASRLSQLEMLTPDERKQLLEGFNDTNAEYPRDKTVMDLFEAQVLRTPEAVAVVYEGQELSYRELNERSNQLGHYLRGKGVKAEDLIEINLKLNEWMIVAILGILKSGATYLTIQKDNTTTEIAESKNEKYAYLINEEELEIFNQNRHGYHKTNLLIYRRGPSSVLSIMYLDSNKSNKIVIKENDFHFIKKQKRELTKA